MSGTDSFHSVSREVSSEDFCKMQPAVLIVLILFYSLGQVFLSVSDEMVAFEKIRKTYFSL